MEPFAFEAVRHLGGFAYIASPYSKYPENLGGIYGAFQEVCRCAAWLIRGGLGVYSPIGHTHPVAMYGSLDPLRHDIWLPADKPLMDAATCLIVAQMPTWESSYGIGQEIKEFTAAGKPIFGLEWPRKFPIAGGE